MSNGFLSEIPKDGSPYMKLQKGENKFRIMSEPVKGYEWWLKENGEIKYEGDPAKGKEVKRAREDEPLSSELAGATKFFWAFVVWNYATKKIEILELKQKTIMQAIQSLMKNKDWGSAIGTEGYDITITGIGDGMERRYPSTQPSPKKLLAPEIIKANNRANIKLDALFDGDDPFKVGKEMKAEVKNETKKTEVSIEDFDTFINETK